MLISFEGGEGSGKTSLIEKLYRTLMERGHQVVTTREPGGTELGEQIRAILLQSSISIGNDAELLLMLAARVQHIEEVIKPALFLGKIVLCDRFNDSSIAYQGGGRGLGVEEVEKLCNLVCHELMPTITFFLDIDPEAGMQRLTHSKDRVEKESTSFHQKVRETYHYLAQKYPQRFYRIDAAQTQAAVFSEAMTVINLFSPPKETL